MSWFYLVYPDQNKDLYEEFGKKLEIYIQKKWNY